MVLWYYGIMVLWYLFAGARYSLVLAVLTTALSSLRRFSPSASKCVCGCGGCRGHTAR